MRPVNFGFVCVAGTRQDHRENRSWRPGWGLTREEALASCYYPEDEKLSIIPGGRSVLPWVWPLITPEIPWVRVDAALTDLPEGLWRVGRHQYTSGFPPTYDILALLAPCLRDRMGKTENDQVFGELPKALQVRVLKEVEKHGLVDEHLVTLQAMGETMEGSPEEMWEAWRKLLAENLVDG